MSAHCVLAFEAVYITPVHLVTPRNVKYDGGPHLQYDPDNGYRDICRHIWKR